MNHNSNFTLLITLSLFIFSSCSATEGLEPDKLVIYSGRSESLIGQLIEQFESESDIDVEIRYGSTAELAITILEEGENSPADIYYAQDPGGLGAIAEAGLLATLPDNITSLVHTNFVDPAHRWV
ncbi:MAG: iron ABC transporter substrate-binding protein, partial [Chloroflexota bacterium]